MNIWFLGGTELGQQERAYQEIRTDISKRIQKEDADAEIHNASFFIGEDEIQSIVDEVLSSALFVRYKIIVVHSMDKASAAVCTKIAAACKQSSEEVFVILRGDNYKLPAALENLIPKKNKKIFWKLSESDYSEYVFERARALHIHLHPDAVDLIVHLGAEHTHELDMILNSIAQHVRVQSTSKEVSEKSHVAATKKVVVEKESIEAWIAHYKSESVFSLFAMLSVRRYENAIDILATLMRSQESLVAIVAGLIYQIKNTVRISEQCLHGMSVKNACALLKIRGGYTVHNQYKDFIANLSLAALQNMLGLCTAADIALRSGSSARHQQLLVSKMLYDIIAIMQSADA